MPDFEQGSYTDPKRLPNSHNLYFIKEGFIFKDEELGDALRLAWKTITGDAALPPVNEAKNMKEAFAEYLMRRKNRRDFATMGQRHGKRKKAELAKLFDYATSFIINDWGTEVSPFGRM